MLHPVNADASLDIAKASSLLGDGHFVGPGDRQSQMFQDVGGGESAKAVKGFGKRSRGYAMQWAMDKGKG